MFEQLEKKVEKLIERCGELRLPVFNILDLIL